MLPELATVVACRDLDDAGTTRSIQREVGERQTLGIGS